MDKLTFEQACDKIIDVEHKRNGIGTLGEKTLHAILKHYFEPNEEMHEIKIGAYIADIVSDKKIIEIQTGNFNKLRKKLEIFLEAHCVTIVYPIANIKWLYWIDNDTGEVSKKRKSPKQGTPYQIYYELYKIKQLLHHPNFNLCIVMLNMEEYRYLNGWSKDKKRGSSRCNRIPVEMIREISINTIDDYIKLIPKNLEKEFTSKDFKKHSNLSLHSSQTALNVLCHIGVVKRVGKRGNLYLYEII